MNKIFLGLLVLVLFTGCDTMLGDFIQGKDVYDHIREPSLKFETPYDANIWLYWNVRYKSKSTVHDWQPPQMTIDRKTGNCIDYSIFMAWYFEEAGYDVQILRLMRKGESIGHAIIRVDGVEWEPQGICRSTYWYDYISHEWSLKEALEICYYQDGNRAVEMEELLWD